MVLSVSTTCADSEMFAFSSSFYLVQGLKLLTMVSILACPVNV